ncbi:class II fructose-bisphosphate aldolase [soil metagenome]
MGRKRNTMQTFESVRELLDAFQRFGSLTESGITVTDADGLRSNLMDNLTFSAIFGSDDVKSAARWLIWEISQEIGCPAASIHEYYMAGGQDQWANRTTPAINVRGMTYDFVRTVLQAAHKMDVGQLIFEIARSEIGYTDQQPEEYATAVLAAAIREGHQGPVFIQGDHFQINASNYASDPEKEVQGVRDIITEGIAAGFYNIDVDSSTIVDLSLGGEDAQQAENARRTADLTAFIRGLEPDGITVSVGGEIGEVGTQNSTVPELKAFMNAYKRELAQIDGALTGISKISVQTGTSHGGVPLADGTVAQVSVDFETLGEMSKVSREEYGLSGAVQHGASTLPEEAFKLFADANASEVHLATGFQNIIFDSPSLPADLKAQIYAWLAENRASERKDGMTDAQFYYTTRKRGFGPFKKEFWNLPEEHKSAICTELRDRFELIFERLGVANTREQVNALTPTPRLQKERPASISEAFVAGD